MDIEIHFNQEDETKDEGLKQYAFENIQGAAYFMGLIQQGVKYGGEMYVMEDHYLDVDNNTVIINCITVAHAEKKIAAQRSEMMSQVSPEFLDRLGPAFKGGDGGGEGGGFLN